MSEKKPRGGQGQQPPDPRTLILQLFGEYESEISETLWPWETARWHELVFCILATIGQPEVLAAPVRRLANTLVALELLDIGALATLSTSGDAEDAADPLLVTLKTLLQKGGFSREKSTAAVTAICQVAASIEDKYNGKVQNCLRKHGTHMLDQIREDIGLAQSADGRKALAVWLQNVLNMPVPASNPLADRACESLGVAYDVLVEAANEEDINVALVDDALRAYWHKNLGKEAD